MSTCYRKVNGLIVAEGGWSLCKDHKGLCCQNQDLCLAEQICHKPTASSTNGSGYYIGLCSDPSYQSTSCSSRCSDDQWGDVVYNFNTNLWSCCGTNTACNNPTDETFLAPPPEQLLNAASSLAATMTSSSRTTSSATRTATPTQSATSNQASSSSRAAKAGIGVGAAVAAIVILALAIWIVTLRKRLRSPEQYSEGSHNGNTGARHYIPPELPHGVAYKPELIGYSRPHEMEGR